MSSESKRRRVGEGDSGGGDGVPPVGGDHQNDNTSVHRELREMKSKMNELMVQFSLVQFSSLVY